MRADKAEFNADKAAPDPLIGAMTKMIVATNSVKAGTPRPSPAPVDITGDHAVSFEPGDPPRSGSLVIYDSSRQPDPPLLADEVEVVLPTVSGTGVRRRTVSARRVPVIEAVALLRDLDAGSPSAAAWSTALTVGLGLIARGRLYPSVTTAGWDTWRAGPFDPADPRILAELAPAKGAWTRDVGPLPAAPLPSRRAGRPAVLAADPPPGSGVDLAALRALAADAAARAVALARGGDSHALDLTEREDLARRATLLLAGNDSNADSSAFGELARRAGRPGRELLRDALAFRDGGVEGLAVLDEAWEPDSVRLADGRSLLGPGATVRHNRVTLGERQLRLGRSGRWYRFRKDRGSWSPDGPPILPVADDDDVGDLPEQ